MKRLTRERFLALPEGVLYAKASNEALHLKGETVSGVDWYCMGFSEIDSPANEGEEVGPPTFDAEDRMLAEGMHMPMCNSWVRDGLFDKDETFYVLDEDDLDRLEQIVKIARAALRGEHGQPRAIISEVLDGDVLAGLRMVKREEDRMQFTRYDAGSRLAVDMRVTLLAAGLIVPAPRRPGFYVLTVLGSDTLATRDPGIG